MTDLDRMTTDPKRARDLERVADQLEELNGWLRRLTVAVEKDDL